MMVLWRKRSKTVEHEPAEGPLASSGQAYVMASSACTSFYTLGFPEIICIIRRRQK